MESYRGVVDPEGVLWRGFQGGEFCFLFSSFDDVAFESSGILSSDA